MHIDKIFIGNAVKNADVTDEEVWRTSEEGGRHFKIETETGEIKAGFGGKLNGQTLKPKKNPDAFKKAKRQYEQFGEQYKQHLSQLSQRIEEKKKLADLANSTHVGVRKKAEAAKKSLEKLRQEFDIVWKRAENESEDTPLF